MLFFFTHFVVLKKKDEKQEFVSPPNMADTRKLLALITPWSTFFFTYRKGVKSIY